MQIARYPSYIILSFETVHTILYPLSLFYNRSSFCKTHHRYTKVFHLHSYQQTPYKHNYFDHFVTSVKPNNG